MAEPARFRFDPTISWGNVLVVLGILVSAIAVYVAGEVRANSLEFRVRAIEIVADRYEKLSDQLVEIKVELAAIKARLPQPQSSLTR